ncbi:hypothetical protein HN587_03110 [Candidatus Woesearchaeota archaeon]|jgi:hypothetical protein|nr:hypothetical protein [Candidatus Woesearchaeota archaeon]
MQKILLFMSLLILSMFVIGCAPNYPSVPPANPNQNYAERPPRELPQTSTNTPTNNPVPASSPTDSLSNVEANIVEDAGVGVASDVDDLDSEFDLGELESLDEDLENFQI